MASDIYIEIDGIKGESTDANHKGQIEVLSWSWGVSQTGTMARGGGGGAGKANVQDFQFVHRYDKASPNLFVHCATGKHIPKATIVQRKAAGDKSLDFLTWKLSDIIISSVSSSANGNGEIPVESVSLNFRKIEVLYKEQGPDGKSVSEAPGGYDVGQAKKV
jgi:type VI secretion system secreted protein Hcp